jgi:hypothetical protein
MSVPGRVEEQRAWVGKGVVAVWRGLWSPGLCLAGYTERADCDRQVRFRVFLPTQLLCVALSLPAVRRVCGAAMGAGGAGVGCVGAVAAALVVVGFAVPAAVIYSWEARLRAAFLARVRSK